MRCGSSLRSIGSRGRQPLRVGATPVPHAEVLDFVRPALAEQGVDLQIKIFESFDAPNDLLVTGFLQANFFQYLPFLEHFNRRTGATLRAVTPVHIEPFGLYARPGSGIGNAADIPEFAEVALPADVVNIDRALGLLHRLGLLDCPSGVSPRTLTDIRSNPRELILKEVNSWLLGGIRNDFDLAFLFGNQAMALGLDTGVDSGEALYCDRDPAYAEYLVTRDELRTDPRIRALATELAGDRVRTFLLTAYRGQVTPAF
ncbi:MAG: MetQ/NlpA family ABC transporter substrate-binding protein [Mycobacterium sp.]